MLHLAVRVAEVATIVSGRLVTLLSKTSAAVVLPLIDGEFHL